MIDIIFRFDPADAGRAASPRTASDALRDLNEGNRCFANLLSTEGAAASEVIRCDPAWAGLSGATPPQRPFSAVLGCADARVPVELIFQRAVNDLFIVRVAGNILTTEGLGSLEFARANLGESLRLMVVLGHTSCGAVTAAVDAYLSPETYFSIATTHGLRALVDNILVAVRVAELALSNAYGAGVRERPGFREALLGMTIVTNAAFSAMGLRRELSLGADEVAFGVYDLLTRRVFVPSERGSEGGLALPPDDLAGLSALGLATARSPFIASLLDGVIAS
jgi:carbonic anhydrase